MSLSLTPERLRAVYAALLAFPPFCRMNLPKPAAVQFRLRRTKALDGEYWRWKGTDKHCLDISVHRNGHWNTVGVTMAHEMIHLHQARQKTESRTEHNAEFRRIARRVCRRFGFDEKQFL